MGLFTAKAEKIAKPEKNFIELIVEYAQSLGYAVILAVLIRGFIFEPFKIPSESMVPTLLVGDHIFVKRFAYGLRVPLTKKWIAEFSDPVPGDVVVFSFPEDEDVDFIKRVVGVPGDKVAMHGGELYINESKVDYAGLKLAGKDKENRCWMDFNAESEAKVPDLLKPFPYFRNVKSFTPQLETFPNGQTHITQRSKASPNELEFEVTVPPRHFFVLGDNRDQSQDSRFWGFVPRENLKGKAIFIWLSLNYEGVSCPGEILRIRWDRFGRRII